MKIAINPQKTQWREILKRPQVNQQQLSEIVSQIFDEVGRDGDKAVKKYTHFFDRVDVEDLLVAQAEIDRAVNQIDGELKEAILKAKENIEIFHKAQMPEIKRIETSPGVYCWQEMRGIEKVGLYVPGGSAPLFSTVLMLAIPARIAGCEEIVLCTPPNKDGTVNPAILFAAAICGVDKVIKTGGIQAVAALTYGTESIPQVYKVVGPGNQYVTAAKLYAQLKGMAIDMPAGPSELMVVADESSIADFVAADLLSQAEHGTDSQVICLLTKEKLLNPIKTAVLSQLEDLPRKSIAQEALENARFLVVEDFHQRIEIINEYAAEHLILAVKDPEVYVPKIKNAGSVFIGNNSPESVGDYASGTNHTLPTNGFAKAYSGVNLNTFCKQITFQELSTEGLENIAPIVEKMAEAEGLYAHKKAVSIRVSQKATVL